MFNAVVHNLDEVEVEKSELIEQKNNLKSVQSKNRVEQTQQKLPNSAQKIFSYK